jgi:hypothetical protein
MGTDIQVGPTGRSLLPLVTTNPSTPARVLQSGA